MGFNLFFDIAAISILAFLMLSIILKKQIIGTSNKLYLLLLIIFLASTILDILASLDNLYIQVLFILNTFFVLLRGLAALMLFFYACNLAKVYYKLKGIKWVYVLLFLPFLALVIALIINFFNKAVFDYLEGPQYKRGDWMTIAYVVSYLYITAAIVVLITSRKYHTKSQMIALVAAFLLQVSASVFQYFIKDILVEMFVGSLTLLTLSLFIESPENFVDYKTNNLNFHSFTVEAHRRFDAKQKFSILLIHVTNTASLYNLFKTEDAIAFNRACSLEVAAKAKKIDHSLLVYYLGGATFAYLFENRDKDQKILNVVQDAFSKPMTHLGFTFKFGIKTCLADCPEDCDNVAALIAFANTFPDLSKADYLDLKPFRKEGGNLLFELDHILERAIRSRSFSVYYQGIYDIKEKKFVAAEALLRLNDPVFGIIMPSLMIPYAEKRGKIIEISKIMMDKCFEFFDTKLRGELDYIEVNLSPLQLLDPNLLSDIEALASKHNINKNEVIFEMTEETITSGEKTQEHNIDALMQAGYRIAIDDFGTGYSNLSRLMQFDIEVLKFDRSMTNLFALGEQDDFFIGVANIFKNRGIKLLFEGVENKDVAEKLETMGVDHIQGFYYSKTIPEDQFLKLIGK